MSRFVFGLSLALLAFPIGTALAQPYYARGDFYAGSGAIWSVDDGNRLYDDGLHDDGAAGDGVYAATVVSDQPPGMHEFKIANVDWSESWPHHPAYPTQNGRLLTTTAGEAVFFRLDTNPREGWQPESGGVMSDHAMPAGTTLELIGSAPELGSWNSPVTALLQDGVWYATVSISTLGPIEYKFRSAGSWDWSFGLQYNMLIGDNFAFVVDTRPSFVLIEFDTRDGRSRVAFPVPVERTSWGSIKAGAGAR